MTDLSKSLELSLWNSDFNDITKDIIECSIDSLIDNEFIKQIPIIKTICGISKAYLSIREKNFIKQLTVFLINVSDGKASEKEKSKYLQQLSNEKDKRKVLERLLLLLEKNIETEKSIAYANIFKGFINGKITKNEFFEMTIITDSLFMTDVNTLNLIFKCEKNSKNCDISNINRLSALGLIHQVESVEDGVLNLGTTNSELTSIGKKYCEIIFNN